MYHDEKNISIIYYKFKFIDFNYLNTIQLAFGCGSKNKIKKLTTKITFVRMQPLIGLKLKKKKFDTTLIKNL